MTRLLHLGPGGRVLIACISIGHGLQRLINATWGVEVGWLPAWLYGLLLVILGLWVLLTTRYRQRWRGRVSTLTLSGLWATLLGDILTVSFTSAFIAFCFTCYLVLEASAIDDC